MSRPRKITVLLSEQKDLDARLTQDLSRPVYSAIRTCFISKFAQYHALLKKATAARMRGSVSPRTLATTESKLDRLDGECIQLAELLFPDADIPLGLRARRWEAMFGSRDWRDPEILKSLRRILRRWKARRGRPATLRSIALRALDLQSSDRKHWTWKTLAEKLCNCGATDHGFGCREKLRREALLLRDLLQSLRVERPAPAK